MRRSLVITLILLTAAWSGLCCYTLPCVVRRSAEVPSCCHVPADGRPEPCKQDCPYRKHRERPATLAEAVTTDLPALAFDFDAWDVAAPVPGVLVSVDAVGLPPPFLSAGLLLHVHHRLRC